MVYCEKKIVLILANNDVGLFKFRRELLSELMNPGSYLLGRTGESYEVYISLPSGEFVAEMEQMGCHFIETPIDRHGMNPISEIRLFRYYKRIMREICPDIVFSYTIKPNIYGAMACKKLGIACVANITGLGTAVENGGILQFVTVILYKLAFSKIQRVYFQNEENRWFFVKKKIALGKHGMLPGSGVNLAKFSPIGYPKEDTLEFAFIARIMREKGIDNYLEAARIIHEKYANTVFHVCGFCENEYNGKLQEYIDSGSVIYHGMVKDIREVHKRVHCVIHPTYYPEGLSNVLLEACASGRPIITTDRAGCREVIDDGINGFVVKQQDTGDLVKAIEKFIHLPYESKMKMGQVAREKVVNKFDRQLVVDAYLRELRGICKEIE